LGGEVNVRNGGERLLAQAIAKLHGIHSSGRRVLRAPSNRFDIFGPTARRFSRLRAGKAASLGDGGLRLLNLTFERMRRQIGVRKGDRKPRAIDLW
jgi:hypothetical protein